MIDCPDCRAWWKDHGRDLDIDKRPLCRADAELVHWWHRPMHPNEVGRGRRAAAARAWAAWEALTPS